MHLAGEPIAARRGRRSRSARSSTAAAATTATLATTLAALDRRPRVLVSGSAIGYYGDRGDEVLREDSPAGRRLPRRRCVKRGRRRPRPPSDAGIRVAHIRTGLVLGQGGALGKMLPLFRLGLGGRFGSGRQWWSWISLDDEIGAIRFLLDHDVSWPGEPDRTRTGHQRRVHRARSGGVLHRPAVLPVPRFGPQLLLGRELGDQLLFSSQRVEPAVLAESRLPVPSPRRDVALRACRASRRVAPSPSNSATSAACGCRRRRGSSRRSCSCSSPARRRASRTLRTCRGGAGTARRP